MKVKKLSEELFAAKTQREKDEILKKMEVHCASMSEKEREDAEKELSVIMKKGLQDVSKAVQEINWQ
ncbi:MAG: hypothetical protein LBU62_11280 [Bacteroidales bacterium]|jgi:hypothetical protein|nr:hypothetical protein [Bacteroidales bacterium]